MTDVNTFKGIYVAMYSAYNSAGEVETSRVKQLARYYVGTGVKGLYVGGSSGEGLLQSSCERKKVLETVISEVKDELLVIAHVGANSTREAVDLSRHAETCGADAISAVPGIYYPLSEQAVHNHWKEMIDSSRLPFIIYNIPQTTGFNLSLELLKKMAVYPNVVGVKMSGVSTFDLQQYKFGAGKNFLVFNGPDEQYLAGRIMGADGGIGGTYGIMPELFVSLEKRYASGNMEEAQALQNDINKIISTLLKYPSLQGATKYILSLRGIDTGQPRLPLLPVQDSDHDSLSTLNNEIISLTRKYM